MMLKKVSDGISLTLQSLIAAMLFGLVAINVLQVFTRYVFDIIVLWVEDVSTLSLCYMVSFGIPWLWLKKQHIFMDVLDIVVPERIIGIMKDAIEVIGFFSGLVLIYIAYVTINVNSGYIYSVLRYDEKLRYIPLMIAGVGLTVAALINIVLRVQEIRKEKNKDAV